MTSQTDNVPDDWLIALGNAVPFSRRELPRQTGCAEGPLARRRQGTHTTNVAGRARYADELSNDWLARYARRNVRIAKRHNFSRGPETHGSHNVRAPGSIGASADPARVFKGMRMPGQMGARRVTQRGARVFDVDAERNLLLIRGSVPGGRNATVEVRSDG